MIVKSLFICLFVVAGSISPGLTQTIDSLFTFNPGQDIIQYRGDQGHLSLWLADGTIVVLDTNKTVQYSFNAEMDTSILKDSTSFETYFVFPEYNKRGVISSSKNSTLEQLMYLARYRTKIKIWNLESNELLVDDEFSGGGWKIVFQKSLNLAAVLYLKGQICLVRLYDLSSGDLIWDKEVIRPSHNLFFDEKSLYIIAEFEIARYELDFQGTIVDSSHMTSQSVLSQLYIFKECDGVSENITIFREKKTVAVGPIRFVANDAFYQKPYLGPIYDTLFTSHFFRVYKVGESELIINYENHDSLTFFDYETGLKSYILKDNRITQDVYMVQLTANTFAIATDNRRPYQSIFVFRINNPQ